MAKKNSKRGFTLVELIVVLVILAILAALLIPALTGYIDKARKSQAVAETRMLMQAVQTEMSTLYGSNEYAELVSKNKSTFTVAAKDGKPVLDDVQKLLNLADRYNTIVKLSEVPSLADGTGSFFAVANYKCQLKWVVYSDGKGYYGVYCQADGTVTGYSDKEVKGYETAYAKNIGKVICDATADVTSTTETLPWTPTMVRLNLGISVN
ncbi:MAG: prepilin-type N-terminal cleavage/methylation domain-containing protein [Oscillospiraceae bacterium]|nr:prepilin-type N-terminal cleavage/methylation domain-containing protein [Oscillospiraceae bacterium]